MPKNHTKRDIIGNRRASPGDAIVMEGITKNFGPVVANDNVNITIPKASIFGLIGENGAGKSTLMKILYGMYKPDKGRLSIFGQHHDISSPSKALDLGIGMVHQHFMLVDRMTVTENVLLGRVTRFRLDHDFNDARKRIENIASTYGLRVDPDAVVADLPVGIKQRVEIIKALFHGASILILDEPTAVLTVQETDQLFAIIRQLQKDSVTCVLITHKLREILAVTDRVSVIRAGKVVGNFLTKDCDEKRLSTAIIGHEPIKLASRTNKVTHDIALSVKSLTYRDERGIDRINDISFSLHKGEILGIAGVTGNGQSELLELLAGMLKPSSGQIRVGSQIFDRTNSYGGRQARNFGIAHVPEDRLLTGIVGDLSAELNYLLGYQYNEIKVSNLIDMNHLSRQCQQGMSRFNIQPPNTRLTAKSFSGGNQQKLIIAREMSRQSKVLLAGQPTRGVDIGAIASIHNILIDHRNQGGSILLVSSELDEILQLSDRIIVMLNGRVSGETTAENADRQKLGLWMTSESSTTQPPNIRREE